MTTWEERVQDIRNVLARGRALILPPRILLGHDASSPIYLEGKDLTNSIHTLGAAREGKSKQLEGIFRQFILHGIGGAVIDPHGTLYNDLLAFCSHQSSRNPEILDRLVLFDPTDDEYVVGLNVLQPFAGLDPEVLVLSRMYAALKARGKNDFDDMPTAKVWLQNILTPLFLNDLTIIEARYLIDRGALNNPIAATILKTCGMDLIKHDWEWLTSSSKRVQYEELLSSINMLRNFVTSSRMELILGRRHHVLDLRQIMDQGKLLLINLGGQNLPDDIRTMLGTLLVNEFFLAVRTRPIGSSPFFLAIDEFENYVTEDIANILDQGHKFGIRLILAHHSLDQLRASSTRVYSAVMQNAKTKIVYGGLTYENAEVLAKELFSYSGAGAIDPSRIKHEQLSPYLEPHESSRHVFGFAHTDSTSTGNASQSGRSLQAAHTMIPIDQLLASDKLAAYITADSAMSSSASHKLQSSADSAIDTIIPFIEHELKWYVSGLQFAPIQEQVHELVARMKNLPERICMLKFAKGPVHILRTNHVPTPFVLPGELREFANYVNSRSSAHLPLALARQARQEINHTLQVKSHCTSQHTEPTRWE